MPITTVLSDAATATLTVVADYPVPLARLWEAYADPRQLERFWGPETWPATFTRHDMAVGGESHYVMRGPDGGESRGWWRFLEVEPMRHFVVEDGFASEDGSVNPAMPSMRMTFAFEATAGGSRVTNVTVFPSADAMEQLVQMGMMEGMRSAMGQIDAVLADLTTFAATRAAEAQLLSDTQVRVSRVIRGTVAQVWRAHHEPALLQRWLLGPEGWTMPVCEVAAGVGDGYRYEWASADGPSTRNALTLVAVPAGTLLTVVITYPSRELRDMILGTGMVDGMEASYARLERELLAVL